MQVDARGIKDPKHACINEQRYCVQDSMTFALLAYLLRRQPNQPVESSVKGLSISQSIRA